VNGTHKVCPKTNELIAVLDELASVLESDENTQWSGWVRQTRARLINSDYSGIEHLLAAYGGMGSLSDVVLGQSYEDGVFKWKPGQVALNERFAALREKAWQLAEAIKRSQ
jgi:hypothetical protein